MQGESKVSKVTSSLKSFLKDFIKNKKTGEGENEEELEMEELNNQRPDSSEDFVIGDDEPLEVVHQDEDEQDITQVSKNEKEDSIENVYKCDQCDYASIRLGHIKAHLL